MGVSEKEISNQDLPYKIFISHKVTENGHAVRELTAILKRYASEDQLQIYVSTEVYPGEHWIERVHNELDESDLLLYIYCYNSPPSINDWCNYETGYFAKKSNRSNIITLVPQGVTPPPPLQDYQIFDLTNDGINYLLKKIYLDLNIRPDIFIIDNKDSLEGMIGEILTVFSQDEERFSQDEERFGIKRIFISYRRQDSEDTTGRIYDRLIGDLGKSAVFKDVDSIPLGADFRAQIEEQLQNCEYFLAVIGKEWLDITNENGMRRLEDTRDHVRIEIQAAIKKGIQVIPILVQGAKVPHWKKLPDEIKDLSYKNGISIRPDPDFHRDMDRLIEQIKQ